MSNTVEISSIKKNGEYKYIFDIQSDTTQNFFTLSSEKEIDQNQLEKIKKALKNFDVEKSITLEDQQTTKSIEEIITDFLKGQNINLGKIKVEEFSNFPTDFINHAKLKKEDNNTYTFTINRPPLEKEITFSTNTSLNDDQKKAITQKIDDLHSGNKNPTSKELFKAINEIASLRGYIRNHDITPNDSEIKYSIKSQDETLSLNVRTKNGLPPGPKTVAYLQGRIDKIEAKTDPVERKRQTKILQKELFEYMKTLGDGKENNLLGADVVGGSPNLEPENVTISFAANPRNLKMLIYKIDTGAETFYVQTNQRLPESALKELTKLASDATLVEASINNYLKEKNITGKVINQTNDIKNLKYGMSKTFQVNQQIDPPNTNQKISVVSPGGL